MNNKINEQRAYLILMSILWIPFILSSQNYLSEWWGKYLLFSRIILCLLPLTIFIFSFYIKHYFANLEFKLFLIFMLVQATHASCEASNKLDFYFYVPILYLLSSIAFHGTFKTWILKYFPIINLILLFPLFTKDKSLFTTVAVFVDNFSLLVGLYIISFVLIKISTSKFELLEKNILLQEQIIEEKRIRIKLVEEEVDRLKTEIIAKSILAAIGQTAAMLAHDVRKPFASVKALLANLNFFVKNPDKLDLAQKDLNKTISNVENMIADIMDFSREQKYELSRIDIKSIIENSVLEIKQNINEKFHIIFKTEFNHKNFPLIEEHKIKRVFQNILNNAVEAITIMGNKTSGNIEIKTEEVLGKFVIKISNDGPKLSEEAGENIFESFFTSGKNSGTGLGLASVKKIIELHGGTITAKNIENSDGVEFLISLPNKI